MNFQKCKDLFLKSALKNDKENLEIINEEFKKLKYDLSGTFDINPNDSELLAKTVADTQNSKYNKDAHIKFQFLTAMKTAMELSDIIDVEAPKQEDKTEIKEPQLLGEPGMSVTNLERNEEIIRKYVQNQLKVMNKYEKKAVQLELF